jgi:hypothetical protein
MDEASKSHGCGARLGPAFISFATHDTSLHDLGGSPQKWEKGLQTLPMQLFLLKGFCRQLASSKRVDGTGGQFYGGGGGEREDGSDKGTKRDDNGAISTLATVDRGAPFSNSTRGEMAVHGTFPHQQ